jgi:hypothetical protein
MRISELRKIVREVVRNSVKESVFDNKGLERAGTGLPQTEEEPIEHPIEEGHSCGCNEVHDCGCGGHSVNESTEPTIITQMRDIVKSGYKKLKDPKTGQTMMVDAYSASAIVKVYDALKQPKNKEQFASMGLLGMQKMAFKLIK